MKCKKCNALLPRDHNPAIEECFPCWTRGEDNSFFKAQISWKRAIVPFILISIGVILFLFVK